MIRTISILAIVFSTVIYSGYAVAEVSAECEFQIENAKVAVRMLTLSEPVYDCLKKVNYQDLLITNGDGHSVPFKIRNPTSKNKSTLYTKALKYNADIIPTDSKLREKIHQLMRFGVYPENSLGFNSWKHENIHLTAFVIENVDMGEGIQNINLGITNHREDGVSATVYTEYSDDLSQWVSSGKAQKLFFPKSDDSGFTRSRLTFKDNKQWPYIRVVVLSNVDNFVNALRSVEAEYTKARAVDPDFNWVKAAKIQQIEDKNTWQVLFSSRLPISRLRFAANNDVVYYQGSLYQSITPRFRAGGSLMGIPVQSQKPVKRIKQKIKDKFGSVSMIDEDERQLIVPVMPRWRRFSEFQQYHAVSKDDQLSVQVEPISFATIFTKKLLIKFNQPTLEMNVKRFPDIEFAWAGAQVQFLAQGPGPFTLLAGISGEIPKVKGGGVLNSWPENLKQLSITQLVKNPSHTVVDSTGDPSTKATAGVVKGKPKFYLWIMLLGGVFVMLLMALQLLRRVSKKDDKSVE